MILQVPFEQFASTVKRVLKQKEVFVTSRGNTALATSASDDRNTVVASASLFSLAEARTQLEKEGLQVFDGSWHTDGLVDLGSDQEAPFVAAVAYVSEEHTPGLWIDAYPSLPTHITVLKALYEEFRQTGQVADVTFEEFVRMAKPTVVVTTPEELRGFVDQHRS